MALSPAIKAYATKRSADFQSAVSRIYNLRRVKIRMAENKTRAAECNSAIQQIENLRYKFIPSSFLRFSQK